MFLELIIVRNAYYFTGHGVFTRVLYHFFTLMLYSKRII